MQVAPVQAGHDSHAALFIRSVEGSRDYRRADVRAGYWVGSRQNFLCFGLLSAGLAVFSGALS